MITTTQTTKTTTTYTIGYDELARYINEVKMREITDILEKEMNKPTQTYMSSKAYQRNTKYMLKYKSKVDNHEGYYLGQKENGITGFIGVGSRYDARLMTLEEAVNVINLQRRNHQWEYYNWEIINIYQE